MSRATSCPAPSRLPRAVTSDERCARLGSVQHGLVSRRQALEQGLNEPQIAWRLASGRWHELYPGVYRIAGSPSHWHQWMLGACLWAGDEAVASHRSAAALWGLDGFSPGPVEISVTKGFRHPPRSIIVHRFKDLPEVDRTRFGEMPLTTPARTILDLGALRGSRTVDIALDSALRNSLTSMDELWDVLRRHARRGRAGIRTLRTLLAQRAISATPTESALEVRLFNLIAASTLPLPAKQWPIVERGIELRRLDIAYPENKLAVEGMSYRHHFGRRAWLGDMRRENFLVGRGWRILRFTDDDLRRRSRWIVREIRAALDAKPFSAASAATIAVSAAKNG